MEDRREAFVNAGLQWAGLTQPRVAADAGPRQGDR